MYCLQNPLKMSWLQMKLPLDLIWEQDFTKYNNWLGIMNDMNGMIENNLPTKEELKSVWVLLLKAVPYFLQMS